MYPTQVVATHRRLPRSTALMVATAFALGALTALGVKGALDQRTQTAVAIGATLVTRGDMSAAAYAATHPAATGP
jgi:hypothetical protein